MYLKHLPHSYRIHILELFNRCIREKTHPKAWKLARITMIPKKDNDTSNPSNYRPISVTSCLGKLLERLVCLRLVTFLESNNIISKYQSGFRRHRSTKDNLLFLTQKICESFNRGKNVCAIFFDISKAFDKVWHLGIIYKLYLINTPQYIINWVECFLGNRFFVVQVGNSSSQPVPITAGVPQGAVISPILFNIFINDIPKCNDQENQNRGSTTSYSGLFADDLISWFIFRRPGGLVKKINSYLKKIEKWLQKWRLKMSANKCCYTVFSQNKKDIAKMRYDLRLFGERVPFSKNPVFLGITFDSHLTFNKHMESTIKKTKKRLNIIKILSHKSWGMTETLLFRIYKLLVGSIIDYSSFCATRLSKTWRKKLQVIQNSAIRSIKKLPFDTSTMDLEMYQKQANLVSIEDRLIGLNSSYMTRASRFQNPLSCSTNH